MDPNNLLESLMQQATMLQERMQSLKEEMAAKTAEASSGVGMVTATVNARGEIVALSIDPEAVDPDDLEMLQDLVMAAVNQASREAKKLVADEVGNLAGGLGLPLPPGMDLSSLF